MPNDTFCHYNMIRDYELYITDLGIKIKGIDDKLSVYKTIVSDIAFK